MGLFKKKVDEPDEIRRLRAEVASMSQRLEATEAAKQQLDQQVASLTHRLESPPDPPAGGEQPAGLPGPPVTSGDLDIIRARIQRLGDRIDREVATRPAEGDLATRVDELASRVDDVAVARSMEAFQRAGDDEVGARVDELTRRLDAMAAGAGPGDAVDPEDFTSLQERVDELVGRLELRTPPPPPPEPDEIPDGVPDIAGDDLDGPDDGERVGLTDLADVHERLDSLVDRIDLLDTRVTSISTELVNQLTELGNELDRAGTGGTSTTAVVDDVVEQLRDAQERLAAEQARYQIAFRQELADLANRVRHT